MAEVETLRDLGVARTEVIAVPELRGTRLIRLLDRASISIGSGEIRIPSRRESASAAFLGATFAGEAAPADDVTVARIGESGVEIAVGTPAHVPGWFGSRPVGTAVIARKARFSDPPGRNQVEAAFSGAARALASLAWPAGDRALVVSSLANEVEALCGSPAGPEQVRTGIESVRGEPAEEIADRFGVGPAGARRMIPTLVLHGALAERLGRAVEPVAEDPVGGRFWLAESDRPLADRRPG